MKNKIYCQLNYADTQEPNCSNLGDRILQYESVYQFVKGQNLFDIFEINILKNEWKEHPYLVFKNTTVVDSFDDEFIDLNENDIRNQYSLDKNKNYRIKTNLINNTDNKTNLENGLITINEDSEIIKNILNYKKNNIFISLHIRKGLGVIGSEYNDMNLDGYPDFTWQYYNDLISILKEILNEHGYVIYISSDLPIQVLKDNINHEFISRLDLIESEDEIKIHNEPSSIFYLNANMCDWASIYYSDIAVINSFSSFSSSAAAFNLNEKKVVLSILDYSHEFQVKIDEYLSKRKKVI